MKFKQIIEDNFGIPDEIVRISGSAYHIKINEWNMKLDLFRKSPEVIPPHWIPGSPPVTPAFKMYKSLPVHQYAIKLQLYVPSIYKLVIVGDKVYKFSEWVKGPILLETIKKHPDDIPKVFQSLGCYMAELNRYGITPCDPHFKNFVWTENSKSNVMYVDMKKFLLASPKVHILQMTKACLKSTKGNRAVALNILKGYSNKNDVTDIVNQLNDINWTMGQHTIESITLGEING